MATYLITGGAGFIGGHLARTLAAEGHAVRVVDDLSTGRREALPDAAALEVADINDTDVLDRLMADVDACFHLAAVASVERCNREWLTAHDSNLRGALAVYQAAVGAGVPVVYASSAAVYGTPERVPLDESAATRPLSAYGADKLGCELHARAAGVTHGLRSCGLRFFNVYGQGQDPSSPYTGVVSIFADRLGRGQGLTIFGDGGQTRDFIHVSDVVRALRAAVAVASTDAPVCNVCTGMAVTVSDLARTLAEVLDAPLAVTHGPPRAGDIRESLGDPRRMNSLLGVTASVSLRQGLAALVGAPAP